MNKNELIKKLEQIPNNPIILIKVNNEWKEVLGVGSTGVGGTSEHINGITFYVFNESLINYLGPVP